MPWTTEHIDAAGALRPLRDPDTPEPDTPEPDEDDDGGQEWVPGADRINP
ncbi:hypothetical protein [Streptomyces sp. DH37]|nr:hypothetical protein [Streptomyces sp. DH37]MDG9704550.1 hypothetical protein [Streptomyces sp. DH37]